MAGEWYRKISWTEADQVDFSTRLQRCRSDGTRAQYLRIQASHLQSRGTPEMLVAALGLLERISNEYPQKFELAMTHFQKAECFEALGSVEKAFDSYRSALVVEREFKNMRTMAWLKFGVLAVKKKLSNHYDEALAILDEFKQSLVFPAERYSYFGIIAIVSDQKGDSRTAKECAQKALHAASETNSGFRYHPSAGLVKSPDAIMFNTLKEIAETYS
jgi:tetratricopeptide (TPR) repeat protein